MRGSVRQRGEKWEYVVDIPPSNGRPRQQKRKGGFDSERAAEKALNKLLYEIDQGLVKNSGGITVEKFLERFIEDYAETNVKPKTLDSYKDTVKNLKEGLGKLKLDQLKTHDIQAFLSKLLKDKQKSNTTIRYYYNVLNIALNIGITWGLLAVNPCKGVIPPKKNETEITVLNKKEADQLLEYLNGKPLFLPVYLSLKTGMRRGEILGLQWSDLKGNTLYVKNQLQIIEKEYVLTSPKSKYGKRSIELDDMTVHLLKDIRKQQMMNQKVYKDNYWKKYNLIVCWPDGSPYRPDFPTHSLPNAIESLNKALKEKQQNQLPIVRFHDLRHTHATLLLEMGVPVKVVTERLGHSSTTVTMDLYAHVTSNMQKETINKIKEIFTI